MTAMNWSLNKGRKWGRDGRVMATVVQNGGDLDVSITGCAVFVREFEVEIN